MLRVLPKRFLKYKERVMTTKQALTKEEYMKKHPGAKGMDPNAPSDFAKWMPWVSAGGLGLLTHSIVANAMDKTPEEEKKESGIAWFLRKLAPLGAGALAAYGGYGLGHALSKGASAKAMEKSSDFVGPWNYTVYRDPKTGQLFPPDDNPGWQHPLWRDLFYGAAAGSGLASWWSKARAAKLNQAIAAETAARASASAAAADVFNAQDALRAARRNGAEPQELQRLTKELGDHTNSLSELESTLGKAEKATEALQPGKLGKAVNKTVDWTNKKISGLKSKVTAPLHRAGASMRAWGATKSPWVGKTVNGVVAGGRALRKGIKWLPAGLAAYDLYKQHQYGWPKDDEAKEIVNSPEKWREYLKSHRDDLILNPVDFD